MWRLQSDWYSPTRLHDSPVDYDFPGDRFIPNRSLMDLDQARTLLTTRTTTTEVSTSIYNEEYRRKLKEKLNFDSEGRPFRMLVFRGSPKSGRKSCRLIDEMRHNEADDLNNQTKPSRHLPKTESWILDAPLLKDDYYLNIMDWGKTNVLAIALGPELYLWNADNRNTQVLLKVEAQDDYPSSVSWSHDGQLVAIGHFQSKLQIFDAVTLKQVRSLEGHQSRIGTLAWNGHLLTSGGQDKSIINHDVRAKKSLTSRIIKHTHEICSLKWSSNGRVLASGGNDNKIYIWEASKMRSSNFVHQFDEHSAAVKALSWCPHQWEVLASGGGTSDGCIKLWNLNKGTCINSVDTKAQICGLEWNQHRKELLSGHGYSLSNHENKLCLWRYPSMTNMAVLSRHSSRVLHLSQSPDGLVVVSAGADETLRFWEVFEPPLTHKSLSELDALLSLKSSPIR